MSTRRTIVIGGGGIAGLALAAALDPHRFDVTIVEPRTRLPDVATSLAMWPEAQRALDELGVLDELAAVSPHVTRFPIRRVDGRRTVASDVPASPLVGRRDLLIALDGAVPAGVRRVHGRIDEVDLDELAHDTVAHGAGARGAGADRPIVVGADGVHSAVRRQTWPEQASAIETPFLAVRGVLPEPIDPADMGEYWARGQLIGMGPHRDGTNWFTAFRSSLGPRHVDVADALEEARVRVRATGGAGAAVRRVLDAATPETTLAQRIWVTPALPTYVRDRRVLVGDAAHAMTPNLGRGGCEAIVDAVTLARLLAEHPTETALAEYNRARRRRTRRLARASSTVMRVATAERAQPLRDLALGAVSIATASSRRAASDRERSTLAAR